MTIHNTLDILKKNNGLILQFSYNQSIMILANIANLDAGLFHRLFSILSQRYGIQLIALSLQSILILSL